MVSITSLTGRTFSDSTRIALLSGYINYRSFSQQDLSFPMKMGYPVLRSQSASLGMDIEFNTGKYFHTIGCYASIPSRVSSDNGTGMEMILQPDLTRFFFGRFDYMAERQLITLGKLYAGVNMGASVIGEYRKLVYTGGSCEETFDIGFATGPPGIHLHYPVLPGTGLHFTFTPLFHLPWLNTGRIRAGAPDDTTLFESKYHGFWYETRTTLYLQIRRYTVGAAYGNMVGFAGRNAGFSSSDIVHFKLDRRCSFYIMFEL